MDLSSLFRPGRIGKLELANRIVKSPQNTSLANQDGTVTQRTVNHYKRLAEGGPGLIIVEYAYVDDDASKSVHGQIGISRREHVPGLGWLADEVRAVGAKIGIQLEHCGRQKFLGTAPIKTASDISWSLAEAQYGVRPQPMTKTEIRDAIKAFGDAAQRAWNARFDLVEVHAGHGYLITNFLSPHTNRRQDEYGGSFENRIRILLEIVGDIRGKVPPEFPLSVRLSVSDYEPDGIPISESVELARRLERAGVDVIHASGGHHDRMEYEVSPWFMPRAVHRDGWTAIKGATSIPVVASGSLVAPQLAAEILAEGSADFVSLGRAMLADPDWARKAKEGRILDIVPCIRCNDGCLHRASRVGRSTGCSVNPGMGMEYRYPDVPAAQKKRVAVAGGGPAGLRAAALLVDRGHDVTLFEPNAIGGRLVAAVRSPVKQDLRGLLVHLIHQVEKRNVRVVRAAATPERLSDFDALFVATGATPRPLEGAIPAAHLTSADGMQGPVVVVGGGLTGCDTALWLAGIGLDVTLVEAEPQILAHNEVFTDRAALPSILEKAGVKIRTGIRVRDAADLESGGTVIAACGYDPERTLAKEMDGKLEIEVIGTARTGSRVMDAIHDAFFAARRI